MYVDTDLHCQDSVLNCSYVAPLDYMAATEVLTFSSTSTEQMVEVTIENDELLEIDEVFRAMLELVNASDAGHVQLQPDASTVTILNDDSEYEYDCG